jgi:hypothetical protein
VLCYNPEIYIKMKTTDEIWNWAINTMAVNIRAQTWYNGDQPYNLAGYVNDFSSRMIGYGLFRQVRVPTNSCSIDNLMKNYITFCASDYSLLNGDTNNYGYQWSPFNASYVPANGF